MNFKKKILLSILISLTAIIVVPNVMPELQSAYTVEAASVKINKTKKTLNVGETYTLKVTGTKKKITWSSSNKKIATVNSKGKVTAKKKGTATITAKVGNKKYKCKITVESPKLNKTKQTITVGNKYTLKVSGTTQTITWSSSDKKIATVNSKGKVTAKKEGTATITAKIGGTKYKCKITVNVLPQKEVSTEYKNALAKAESYSKLLHMSKKGIYEQLTSFVENFSSDAAQYAVDNLNVDWKKNALEKAKSYSDTLHMSKKGIYEQLTSFAEQFTEDEAQYAIDNIKVDWKKNALEKAKSYRKTLNMSKSAIYNQLTSFVEQFTSDEAQYAIDHLDD